MAKETKSDMIVDFIREFNHTHGYGPTIREIGEAVGLKSNSTVFNYLTKLTHDGLITSAPGISRTIQVVEPEQTAVAIDNDSTSLVCRFRFPKGTSPEYVFALLRDEYGNILAPIVAEHVETAR